MRLTNPIFFSDTIGLIVTIIFTIVLRFIYAICLHELAQYLVSLRLHLKGKPQCKHSFNLSFSLLMFLVLFFRFKKLNDFFFAFKMKNIQLLLIQEFLYHMRHA